MSLMIWYPLNGDLKHQGISDSTATNSGATVNANGKIGSCYSFNGSTSYIDIDNIPCLSGGSQPFTLAFWVKSMENGTRGVMLGNYNLGYGNFNIEINSGSWTDNRLRFYWKAAPDRGIASAVITYNTWVHVAIVYTGTRLYTYIDGLLKDEVAVVLGTANNPMLRLGRDQRTGATAFSGSLNDIRIYDEALGVAEIREISRALILHYDFNDPDVSTIVYDSSGYGRHGIISSATAPTLSDESICGPYSMEWGEGGNTKLITLPTLPFVTNCTVVYWYKQPTTYAPTLILGAQSGGSYYIMATNASRNDFYNGAPAGSVITYVDGVQTNINPKNSDWHLLAAANVNFSTWTSLKMGGYSGYNLNGKVADIKIYNTVLSAEDIKHIYDVQTAITRNNTLMTSYIAETDYKNIHNIIPNSAYENRNYGSVYTCSAWGGDAGTVTYYPNGGFNDLPYKKITKTAVGTGGIYLRDHEGIPIRYGKTYTIKGYFKVSRTPFTASSYNFTINGNPGNKYYNCGKNLPLTTEWQEFSYTITPVEEDNNKSWAEMCIMYDDLEMPFDFYICGFQVYEERFNTSHSVRNNGVVTWPRFIEIGEYQPIEYIESSAEQFINTNYILTSSRVRFCWRAVDNGGSGTSLFGSETSASPKYSGILYGSKTSRSLYAGTSTGLSMGYSSSDGLVHIWELSFENGEATLKKDGSVVGSRAFLGQLQSTIPIHIFGNKVNSNVSQRVGMRLYHFEIWDDNKMVREFMPCIRKNDGTAGLYDFIEGVFYYNGGTGTFVAGPEISGVGPKNFNSNTLKEV